jgi:long-chain acyl-CoA synthetase
MSSIEDYLADVARRQARVWPAGVPMSVQYVFGEKTIQEHLRHWAETDPDRMALVYYGREVSFAELDDLSDRFAGWLRSQGVSAGDRVAVMLPNCPQYVIAMMGNLKLGAIHVPVSPLAQQLELEHELTDCEPSAFIGVTELLPLAQDVLDGLGVRAVATTSLSDMLPEQPAFPVPDIVTMSSAPSTWSDVLSTPPLTVHERELDAVAALNYTGGTTGLPKGCQHTQRNMLYTAAAARGASPMYTIEDRPVFVLYVPVFWIGGENGVISSIVFGGTLILLTRWDPDAWLDAVEQYAATDVGGTVDNYVELMERSDIGERDLSSVRVARAMSFVKILTPEIRHQWQSLAGSSSLLIESAYGMTETHTLDTTTIGFQEDDYDLLAEPVFCGLPMPGTQLMVVDADRSPLPLGERGSILVRSPSLMKGYWRAPEATARAIDPDGWFDTGDKGMIDEDGCLHFLGRDKDMIKVNGMSVFPAEVEAVLSRHPAVGEVAVVPAPDERRGQVPVAFVRLVEGERLSEQDLESWARRNISSYKVPHVRFVDGFPVTATGKIRKVELTERAALAQDS